MDGTDASDDQTSLPRRRVTAAAHQRVVHPLKIRIFALPYYFFTTILKVLQHGYEPASAKTGGIMRIRHRIVTTMLSVGILAIAGGVLVASSNSRADATGSITFTQFGADIDGDAYDSVEPVAMSADGTRIVIGAPYNGSSRGRVRIYEWSGSQWTQVGADINGAATQDQFGFSVGMSADDTRVVIGAPRHDSYKGHVRIYELNGSQWTQLGTDIVGEAQSDVSGRSVAISADGTRVAIGAFDNDRDWANDTSEGHVRIYDWNGTSWTQVGADIDGELAGDESGWSVAISADGTRVVIGAPRNGGNGAWS
jgi:hypothetical protein